MRIPIKNLLAKKSDSFSYLCIICLKNTEHTIWIRRSVSASPAELYGASSGIPGTQDLAKCSICNFIFEFNRPSDKDILDGYKNSRNDVHDSQYLLRVRSFENALKRISHVLPNSPASILDIGCAGGAFLLAAKNFGHLPKGLEPSKELVDQASNSRDLIVVQGVAEDATNLFDEKFDVVTMWDVLEHVIDPVKTLQIAGSLVKENGIIILNVPDMGTGMAKIVGKRNWWISSVHLYHFRQHHLSELLSRINFSLIAKKRYFQVLELGYLIDIAVQMGIPGTKKVSKLIPRKIKNLKLKYYASQTTFVFGRE
jgi:2-polyprenyl-3-methyl-5-hydroxy-6-metoxy-1,4-benzoquinol methylase